MPIKIKNMSYKYKRGDFNFENLNLHISSKHTAIVGKTGSGKSTLVELLAGIEILHEGSVEILDYKINKKTKLTKLKSLRKDCTIVYQNSENQFAESFVYNEFMFGPQNHNMDMDVAKRDAKFLIKRIGLEIDDLKKNVASFSGGQKRKIAIASMLMLRPKIIILDEPTIGLDPFSKKDLMDFIYDYVNKHDLYLIMVTHDPDVIYNYSDHVIKMNNGKVEFNDSKYQFIDYCSANDILEYLPESIRIVNMVNEKFNINLTSLKEVHAFIKNKSSN